MEQTVLAAINSAEGTVHVSFLPTMVVIALAFAVPILLSRINKRLALPVVVGEIFLGIIAGQVDAQFFGGGTSLLANDELLNILAEIGFGFLFFLAGTEIDVSALRPSRKPNQTSAERFASPLNLGIFTYLLTVGIGMGSCFLLYQQGLLTAENWPFMAIALAPTSLGICVAVLKEKGYARQMLGQFILVAATAADFGTVLILAVYISVVNNGGFTSSVLLILIIFVAFVVVYAIMRPLYGSDRVQALLTKLNTPTSPIKIRFGVLVFLVFVAISQAIDAEIVLGSFMGGILISMLADKDDHEVLHNLESMGYGFFVPIFFIMIGVRLDVLALVNEFQAVVLLVPLLGVIAILNKFLPALLFRLRFGTRDTLAGGMLLTSRISLMAAAAQSGFDLNLFSSAEEASVIVLAMLMATIGPLVFNRTIPSPQEATLPPIVVTHAGDRGLEMATQLTRHGEPVVLIDSDKANVERAQARGFEVIHGNLDRPDEAVAKILRETERFVTVYTEADINYQICNFVKNEYGVPHIVAEVTSPGDFKRFEDLGIAATHPTLDRIALLVVLTRNPASYELMTRMDDDQEVHEVIVRNPELVGQSMREIRLPQGYIVMAVRRRQELIVPNGETRLELGDYVTIVGARGHANTSYQLFSTNTPVAEILQTYDLS